MDDNTKTETIDMRVLDVIASTSYLLGFLETTTREGGDAKVSNDELRGMCGRLGLKIDALTRPPVTLKE